MKKRTTKQLAVWYYERVYKGEPLITAHTSYEAACFSMSRQSSSTDRRVTGPVYFEVQA